MASKAGEFVVARLLCAPLEMCTSRNQLGEDTCTATGVMSQRAQSEFELDLGWYGGNDFDAHRCSR
eukprot:8955606-Pyramimonas_sp.AAC.1